MTWPLWVLIAVLWVAAGGTAVFLLLHRRGHREPSWYILGAVLGPLFIPIAAERSRQRSAVLERHVTSSATARDRAGLVVLVGVDGSPESDRAVADAARLTGAAAGRVLLATVVGADEAEHTDTGEREGARRLLAEAADGFPAEGTAVETEILSGRPAQALAELAAAEGVDLVVVGRRGKGMSRALLGSVAEQLGHSCPVPVLLAGPVGAGGRS